jgi:hypothetical protein
MRAIQPNLRALSRYRCAIVWRPPAEGCEGAGMRTMNHRRGLALERRYSHKELQSIRRTGKMTVYPNKYHEDSI